MHGQQNTKFAQKLICKFHKSGYLKTYLKNGATLKWILREIFWRWKVDYMRLEWDLAARALIWQRNLECIKPGKFLISFNDFQYSRTLLQTLKNWDQHNFNYPVHPRVPRHFNISMCMPSNKTYPCWVHSPTNALLL